MFILLELMEDETIARAVALYAAWYFCFPPLKHAIFGSACGHWLVQFM